MRIDAFERAGHVLRVKAAALAEAVVDELYRRRPDLPGRYGPAGRAHCVKDLWYHLRFLAAAVEMRDAALFADYVGWAADVMASRGVDVRDQLDSLEILRDVAAGAVPAEAAEVARHCVNEGIRRACRGPTSRPAPRLPASSRRRRGGPTASTGGSAPSRS
jgi:MerR family transcriptional regulator, light-induced transcriptional regulator